MLFEKRNRVIFLTGLHIVKTPQKTIAPKQPEILTSLQKSTNKTTKNIPGKHSKVTAATIKERIENYMTKLWYLKQKKNYNNANHLESEIHREKI